MRPRVTMRVTLASTASRRASSPVMTAPEARLAALADCDYELPRGRRRRAGAADPPRGGHGRPRGLRGRPAPGRRVRPARTVAAYGWSLRQLMCGFSEGVEGRPRAPRPRRLRRWRRAAHDHRTARPAHDGSTGGSGTECSSRARRTAAATCSTDCPAASRANSFTTSSGRAARPSQLRSLGL